MTARTKAPKVYLAGPGVFLPEADLFAEHLRTECERLGLERLWPADGPAGTARLIFRANVELIRSADALVADISPFRGPHSDDGTAFEMGFAFALGKPVFAWTSDLDPLAWRISGRQEPGILRDEQGYLIEDFAAPANLMLVEACQSISATPEGAIASAAKRFRTYLRPV